MNTENTSQKIIESLVADTHRPEGTSWDEKYAHTLGMQAYVYGFPWLYLSWIKWLWTTPGGAEFVKLENIANKKQGKAEIKLPSMPVNTFFFSLQLATGETPSGGSPNRDTLYSIAWLDVSKEPIIVTVPEVTDRFYCMQLACIDSDNFGYIGTHVTGTGAGSYLIAGPGWSGLVKKGITDVIPRSRTPEVLIFGRTQVLENNQAAIDEANNIQQSYSLTPLSLWPLCAPTPTEKIPDPHLPPNPILPSANSPEDPQNLETWISMNHAMQKNPPGVLPGIDQTELLNLFATIGIGPNQSLEDLSKATLRGLARAAYDGFAMLNEMPEGRGKNVNGWTYPPRDIGRAGQNSDFITRAALQALAGISAHDAQQAVYMNVAKDSDGHYFQQGKKYKIVLETADSLPPVDETYNGFWSITMYQSWDYNLVVNVKNPLAYSINSYYSEFQSLVKQGGTIYLQQEPPAGYGDGNQGVYWLQTPGNPPDNEEPLSNFYLFLRVYVPGPQLWNTQTWSPPKVQINDD